MIHLGITGGIGTGKSTVCQVFETLGIPVLYADTLAKNLMNHSLILREKIMSIFGAAAYDNGVLNRKYLSDQVFQNAEKLEMLNQLVHPEVSKASKEWQMRQIAAYTLKEAALFFETGTHTQVQYMIGVAAPLELRIARIKNRDGISEEKIHQIIAKQLEESEKLNRCDFILYNDEKSSIIQQVLALHQRILSL